MKKADIYIVLFLALIFTPFIMSGTLYNFYDWFYSAYPFLTSFIKFAILATTGELIGLRIKTGRYIAPGFGILPRALVWGILGMTIQAAFIIFARGVPILLEFTGLKGSIDAMEGSLNAGKLGVAFSISFLLNIFYAPVLMTVHKITDSHIEMTGGTMRGFFTKIKVSQILKQIDWDTHFGFVLKKTIIFFWIPAQTLNFLMPEQFRVLIAAVYGIILGVILAFAAISKPDV
ncbi:MAG: Mpv17/PMP22 family protein [Bacteroidales bacterium]|nr:Mpv17/PMP22 family protein [Bacteroidales bacterium]